MLPVAGLAKWGLVRNRRDDLDLRVDSEQLPHALRTIELSERAIRIGMRAA